MVKKNFALITVPAKKLIIEKTHPTLSVSRQAELLSLSRSSVYYEPKVDLKEVKIMRALDQLYTKHPFYGSRKLRFALADEYGIQICRQYVQRLMQRMGIEAIYPHKKTSTPHPGHKIYPYLLRNVAIARSNQVWGTDLTYIPLAEGFCYLVAIIDWFSRYVLAWELSETMEAAFCARALTTALRQAVPDIHNSDQGAQFTADEYLKILEATTAQISMDGRGRCLDNIFTERLWRTVKYEDIYLHNYPTITDAYDGLTKYFPFYNTERRHQSLGYQTPAQIYFGQK